MASGVIRRFATAEAGRQALLPGRGLLAGDNEALPASVRAGIRATFGQDLSAEEVVQRVLNDVRTRGDSAVRHFTKAFDGVDVAGLRVSDAEIVAAVTRVGDTVMAAL